MEGYRVYSLYTGTGGRARDATANMGMRSQNVIFNVQCIDKAEKKARRSNKVQACLNLHSTLFSFYRNFKNVAKCGDACL